MTHPPGSPSTGTGGSAPAGNSRGNVEAMYYRAVTGRSVPSDDKVTVTRLRALVGRFGSQTAAARAMGVGRSTLGGWLAKKNRPSPASLGKVTGLLRRVREQEVAAATYGRRAARLSAGAVLHVGGIGGPQCTSPDDALRERDLGIVLDAGEAQRLVQLMAANDPAAMDYIADLYADKYMRGTQPWEWSYVEDLRLDF